MRGFYFKGEYSERYGVYVTEPPEIPIAQPRSEAQKILGSSRVVHYAEDEGGGLAMEQVTQSLDCVARADADLLGLAAWLRGGGALVVPGDETHMRYGWVKNQIDLKKVLRARPDRRFTVQFDCEGWRYHWPMPKGYALISGGTLANRGTGSCRPLLRVTGSGDGAVTINGAALAISGLTDYADIDLESQQVYRDGVSLMSHVTREGEWPWVPAGGCAVGWSGGITGASVLEPRWRDY